MVPHSRTRFAQRHDFRMRRGIESRNVPVPSQRDDLSRVYHNRAHGYLAALQRSLGAA